MEAKTDISHEEANRLWGEANDAGHGYAVGDEGDDINELDLGTLIYRSMTDDRVSVYRRDDGQFVAVGNAHGPWACDISDA